MAGAQTDLQQAFIGKIHLVFYYKKSANASPQRIDIHSNRIQYVMLEYKYLNINVLPVVYVSLKVPLDLHDKIIDTYVHSYFDMKIRRKNMTTDTSAAEEIVKDRFDYVCSNTNVNESPVLSSNEEEDKSYVRVTIGMVSKTMSKMLRKTYNGTYLDVDTETMIKKVAFKNLKEIVMSKLKYNKKYKKLEIPTLNTRYRLVKYLFDENPYYDNYFTFFMDFKKKVYLIENNGKPVQADDKPEKCVFHVTDATDPKSFSSGNVIKNNAYHIYVNLANAKITVNEGRDQNVNKVTGFAYKDEDDDVQDLYISDSSGAGQEDKPSTIRHTNVALLVNEIGNSRVFVEMFKSSIDSSIVTPNRKYVIKMVGNYERYNGVYTIAYKKESYTPMGQQEFQVTTSVGLKYLRSLEKAKIKRNKKKESKQGVQDSESTADGSAAGK